ncbi:magnesium transporter CorA family protein [Deinococcus ruber]|uniref:Cation transporter n=1 Tax=Deinococcus ruber TaxID=1848197 RepID=A0A918CKW8_9DEIO|nr:magnesium transporter CorA family protein [Deinococcus ruber]GGR27227.1 cation transporter [Deinococcus ruber]
MQEPPPAHPLLPAYQLTADQAVPLSWHAALTEAPPAGGFLWFDLTEPTPPSLAVLQRHFRLHPLAVEDAIHAHQRAKLETYPGFEFLVAHGVLQTPGGGLGIHELDLFIGEHVVISVRHGSGLPVEEILSRWERVPAAWRADASSLLYVLLDALVDEYGPLVERLETELRTVRRDLTQASGPEEPVLQRIFVLSERIHSAHAVIFPLREVLGALLHAGPPVVSPQEVPYFRDIRDHAVHTLERLELARSQADRAFDIYLALENRRQGASARQLTMVATIFLPLTLVTGFFGQNFSFLIDHVIAGPRAFWTLCIGFELLVAVVTLVLVRRIGARRPLTPAERAALAVMVDR